MPTMDWALWSYVHKHVPLINYFSDRLLGTTRIYKFARHEWVGILAAWDAIPSMARAAKTTDKISRYHLCEEFCHVRSLPTNRRRKGESGSFSMKS